MSPRALRKAHGAFSSLTEEDTGKGPSGRRVSHRSLHWPSQTHPERCTACLCHVDCSCHRMPSPRARGPGPPLEVCWKAPDYVSAPTLPPIPAPAAIWVISSDKYPSRPFLAFYTASSRERGLSLLPAAQTKARCKIL